MDSCPYGSNCRFNHDLEAYLAQVHYIIFFLSLFFILLKRVASYCIEWNLLSAIIYCIMESIL